MAKHFEIPYPVEGCKTCEGTGGIYSCPIHSPNLYVREFPEPFAQMTEQEQKLVRKLSDLFRNPPKSTYESSFGGAYEDTNTYELESQIYRFIKKALPELAKEAEHQREMAENKDLLLADAEISKVIKSFPFEVHKAGKACAQAQLSKVLEAGYVKPETNLALTLNKGGEDVRD